MQTRNSPDPDSSKVAVERTAEETTAEIDAIAVSINMMPLVDPTFTGFFADALPRGGG